MKLNTDYKKGNHRLRHCNVYTVEIQILNYTVDCFNGEDKRSSAHQLDVTERSFLMVYISCCDWIPLLQRRCVYCVHPPPALFLFGADFSGEAAAKVNAQNNPPSRVFDACDSEMWDYVDMQRLMCALIWLVQQEVKWHSSYVTVHDRQTWQTEQQVLVLVTLWRPLLCLPRQDGLVQAAALREGVQRFVHQDCHQKGSQVSDRRMQHARCRTNMWLSSLTGHRFNPLSQSAPKQSFKYAEMSCLERGEYVLYRCVNRKPNDLPWPVSF